MNDYSNVPFFEAGKDPWGFMNPVDAEADYRAVNNAGEASIFCIYKLARSFAGSNGTVWKADREKNRWVQEREFSGPIPDGSTWAPESILAEADKLTNGDRNKDYGPYDQEASSIAAIWSELFKEVLKSPIPPRLVPLAMIGVKINREANRAKRDNLVDIAGYAKLTEKLYEKT